MNRTISLGLVLATVRSLGDSVQINEEKTQDVRAYSSTFTRRAP